MLCYSETGKKLYKPIIHNHPNGKYSDVCGVMPLWSSYLEEQGTKRNTIKGGWTVFQYYLDKTGSKEQALKDYKGIKSDKYMWVVNKVNRVNKEVKKLYLGRNSKQ